MGAEELALAVLEKNATAEVVKRAKEATAAGTHRWIFDPEVEGVLGLISTGAKEQEPGEAVFNFNEFGAMVGNGPNAVIIVYLHEGDFETDEEWLFS
jgi:hypothetical protein